eukprot:TRINITY_DN4261_c1_g1_i3.p1 TRINITY_DN4261_c1_g1~~TRINITY_DN4261_c1_g1_i3.p1  ORF type:complete len:497 (+),score=74.83 TRINITY_DN4261_c1_g1_i3:1008-2498(+)
MAHSNSPSSSSVTATVSSCSSLKLKPNEEPPSLKKGPWTSAEDAILVEYVKKHGEGNWNAVQKCSGLYRCGKSCRLRWANHLRPNLKKGSFTADEERLILELHAKLGNKWARMAAQLPGRTDNEIKNFWNTRIKRRQRAGLPLYPPGIQENKQKELYCSSAEPNRKVTLPFSASLDSFPSFSPLNDAPHFKDTECLKPPCFSSYPLQDTFPSEMFPFPSDLIRGGAVFPLASQDAINDSVNGAWYAFSSSASKPSSGLVETELPSIQVTESAVEVSGSASIAASASLPSFSSHVNSHLDSDFSSCNNSGLLEALLQGEHGKVPPMVTTASCSDFQGASSCSSVNPVDNLLSVHCKLSNSATSDPIASLDNPALLMFNEISLPNGSAILNGSLSRLETGRKVKDEEHSEEYMSSGSGEGDSLSVIMGFHSKMGLPTTDCYIQNSEARNEECLTGENLSSVFNNSLEMGVQHVQPVTLSSNHAWGLSSCPWSNMPSVC